MAKIEYVQDKETGKYTDILVNGKSVVKKNKSFLTAFNKAAGTSFWVLYSTAPFYFVNDNELSSLEYTIFRWVKEWERRYHAYAYDVKRVGAPIATFDNMRYFFMALNSDAYMNLLD